MWGYIYTSMSDTDNLDIAEQVNILFKSYLGFPSTKDTTPFYQETNVTPNNYLYGSELLIDNIPTLPTFDIDVSGSADVNGDVGTGGSDVCESVFDNSGIGGFKASVVRKFVKLELSPVPGSSDMAWYAPGASGANLLADAIQFNKGDSSKPYLYALYDNQGTSIENGPNGGNWIFDTKNGIIMFQDEDKDGAHNQIAGQNTRKPLLTFVKYIGVKGINNAAFAGGATGEDSNFSASITVAQNISTTNGSITSNTTVDAGSSVTAGTTVNAGTDVNAGGDVIAVSDVSAGRNLMVAGTTQLAAGVHDPRLALGRAVADVSAGVHVHIDGSGAIMLPRGTTADRDTLLVGGDDSEGLLRYNTTNKQFEGYSSNSWQGLGGVTDIAQVTKITAANTVSDQDKTLRFFTDNSVNMIIDEDGNVAIGTDLSKVDASFNNAQNLNVIGDISSHNVFVSSNATISGNLGVVGAAGVDGNFDVATNKFTVAAATGNTVIDGTLDVSKNLTVGDSKLTVAHDTGNTAVAGTLTVTNAIDANSTADIADTLTLSKATGTGLSVAADAAITGNLAVTGATGVDGHFDVATTMFTVDSTNGNTAVAGTLGVTGKATFSNNNTENPDSFAIHPTIAANELLQSDNSNKVATTRYVRTAVSNLIDGAPSTLDTLNEIAGVLGDPTDPSGGYASVLKKLADVSGYFDQFELNNYPSAENDQINFQSTWDSSGGYPFEVRYQTFHELLTMQPGQFTEDTGNRAETSSKVTLKWKYDNILALHKTNNVKARLANAAGEGSTNVKQRMIPFIDHIAIDISGTVDGFSAPVNAANSQQWIRLFEINIADTDSYEDGTSGNGMLYKTRDILKTAQTNITADICSNILSREAGQAGARFDARVYGVNFAENYPLPRIRALYFYDLSFAPAGVPSQTVYNSNTIIETGRKLDLDFQNEFTEGSDATSGSVLVSAKTRFNPKSTTQSSHKRNSNITYNDAGAFVMEQTDTLASVNRNTAYEIIVDDLSHGTIYTIQSQAKNNISATFGALSAVQDTSSTRLPDSTANGQAEHDYSNWTATNGWFTRANDSWAVFGGNNTHSIIVGNSTASSSTLVSYPNLINQGSHIYEFNKVPRTMEITRAGKGSDNTITVDQQNQTVGYGSYVDGSSNLLTIKSNIDGADKVTISWGGFTNANKNGTVTQNNDKHFETATVADPYDTNDLTKGFRLEATFQLKDLSAGGDLIARNTPYNITYSLDHSEDLRTGGRANPSDVTINNLYVDQQTSDPGASGFTSKYYHNAFGYSTGIASNRKLNMVHERSYTNVVNTTSKFALSHNNSTNVKLGLIDAVSLTTGFSDINVTKAKNDMNYDTTGEAAANSTTTGIVPRPNGNNYSFTEASGAKKMVVTDKLFNIKRPNGITVTTDATDTAGNNNIKLHCDYNSFSNFGEGTHNVSLGGNDIGYITDIGKLGADLHQIAMTTYTSHSTAAPNHMLLYIDGAWRPTGSNTSGDWDWAYPASDDIFRMNSSGNNTEAITEYAHGNTTFNTAGTLQNNQDGYKWIVFKVNESHATTENNVTYYDLRKLQTGGDQDKGLNSKALDYLKDKNSKCIGFVVQNVSSATRIGWLGRNVNVLNPWYSQTAATTYSNLSSGANLGCMKDDADVTGFGPLLDVANGDQDIFIYIGMTK